MPIDGGRLARTPSGRIVSTNQASESVIAITIKRRRPPIFQHLPMGRQTSFAQPSVPETGTICNVQIFGVIRAFQT